MGNILNLSREIPVRQNSFENIFGLVSHFCHRGNLSHVLIGQACGGDRADERAILHVFWAKLPLLSIILRWRVVTTLNRREQDPANLIEDALERDANTPVFRYGALTI